MDVWTWHNSKRRQGVPYIRIKRDKPCASKGSDQVTPTHDYPLLAAHEAESNHANLATSRHEQTNGRQFQECIRSTLLRQHGQKNRVRIVRRRLRMQLIPINQHQRQVVHQPRQQSQHLRDIMINTLREFDYQIDAIG